LYGFVGCSTLRPAQGALTKPMKTKYLRRLVELIFQKRIIKEIALAISTL
jgi:hypothetical protein